MLLINLKIFLPSPIFAITVYFFPLSTKLLGCFVLIILVLNKIKINLFKRDYFIYKITTIFI